MRDDAGRDAGDSTVSRDAQEGGDQPSDPPWDSTMHRTAADEEEGDRNEHGEEQSDGNVAGQFQPSKTIEPGNPSLENSLFVVFGAYIAVLGLTRLFIDVQGFTARDLLVLTGGMLLISIVLFGFFGLLTPDT